MFLETVMRFCRTEICYKVFMVFCSTKKEGI